MQITKFETIRIAEFPQLVWLQVHTDAGVTGLGETFMNAGSVEAYIHEDIAPAVMGRDALAIDAISRDLVPYVGFGGTGIEVRAASCLDIALWDLFGKSVGHPLMQLLGGRTRSSIRTYNTCAGTQYMRAAATQSTSNWGIQSQKPASAVTGFDDLNDFLTRANDLAESLLSEGITAMKIWPFDIAAEKTTGQYISDEDLKLALKPFEKSVSA